jgi:hypothetical protein
MVSLYPAWLGLQAMEEFVQVTIAGHLAYGIVLGYLARSLLRSSRWGEHDRPPTADAAAAVGPPG